MDHSAAVGKRPGSTLSEVVLIRYSSSVSLTLTQEYISRCDDSSDNLLDNKYKDIILNLKDHTTVLTCFCKLKGNSHNFTNEDHLSQ